MQVQVESLNGGCPCVDGRCPCACSKGTAPLREPPSKAKAEGTDAWGDEENDPWKGFGKKQGGPGGGGGGPGGGGGGPGGGGGLGGGSVGDHDDDDDDNDDVRGFFDIGTPDGKGRKRAHQYEFGRLFEAKDAEFLPDFNGKDKAGLVS